MTAPKAGARGKRANGEGTVFQRRDGRWVARTPPDPRTGKTREFWAPSQAEALERRGAWLAEAQAKGAAPERDPRLSAFLTDWIALTVKPRVRPNTLSAYRNVVTRWLVPELGKMRLSEIQPVDVRRLLDTVARATSPGNARGVRRVLSIALEDARRDRVLIGDNPAKLVRPPKAPRHEPTLVVDDDARAFLAAVEGHKLFPLFALALATGMRQGELFGLRWSDVVLDGASPALHVRVQLSYRKHDDGVWRFELVEPKTERSRRRIPLPPALVAVLKAHKARQAARALELGPLWRNAWGLVFTWDAGRPLERGSVHRVFKDALKSAGVPVSMRFHDLRHSAATMMVERTGDLKAASEALGHSTITLTANTYAHGTERSIARAVGALDDLLASG